MRLIHELKSVLLHAEPVLPGGKVLIENPEHHPVDVSLRKETDEGAVIVLREKDRQDLIHALSTIEDATASELHAAQIIAAVHTTPRKIG
jgi:hypothetical protein